MSNKFSFDISRMAIIVFLCLMFGAYSFLSFNSSLKFDSPDETANYFFTSQFVNNLSFQVPEQLNQIAQFVAPRSIVINNGFLVPGSFIGMPFYYGIMSWFFGNWIILFLSPLFSVLGVIFFYKLINLIFDRRTAFISAGLMAIHPAFWYYTARGMFHNALFLDLLIIGLYFIAKILFFNKKTNYPLQAINYFFAGLFIALAIAVRTSEVIWIGVTLILIVLFFRNNIDWKKGFCIALLTAVIIFVPILKQNKILYGNYLTFSYTVGAEKASSAGSDNLKKVKKQTNIIEKVTSDVVNLLQKAIFPFGINFNNILNTVWNYGIIIVWPFALLTLFGALWYIRELIEELLGLPKSEILKFKILKLFARLPARHGNLKFKIKNYFSNEQFSGGKFIYLSLYLLISIYLILYYGSWKINDNILGSNAISLEQAYNRYWLPIYIFGLPFAALIINYFFEKILLINKRFKALTAVLVCLIIYLAVNFSVSLVMFNNNVGLAKVRGNIIEYKEVALMAKIIIEPDALIVSGKADKVFFPDFKVISSDIDSNKKAKLLKKILQIKPVYVSILNFAGQLEILNKLKSLGFTIGEEIKVGDNVSLYKIIK